MKEPTEMHIAAVMKFLDRGFAITVGERLMELVEFQLPNELSCKLKPSRVKAKVIAILINQLHDDLEGFGDCPNDEIRLAKAGCFLESPEGERWIATHTVIYSPRTPVTFVNTTQQAQGSHAGLLDDVQLPQVSHLGMPPSNVKSLSLSTAPAGTPLDKLVTPQTISHPTTRESSVVAAVIPQEPVRGVDSTLLDPEPEPEPVHVVQQAPEGRRFHGRSLSESHMTPRWYASWPDPGGYDHDRFPYQRSSFDHEAGVNRLRNGRHIQHEDIGIVVFVVGVLIILALVQMLAVYFESSK